MDEQRRAQVLKWFVPNATDPNSLARWDDLHCQLNVPIPIGFDEAEYEKNIADAKAFLATLSGLKAYSESGVGRETPDHFHHNPQMYRESAELLGIDHAMWQFSFTAENYKAVTIKLSHELNPSTFTKDFSLPANASWTTIVDEPANNYVNEGRKKGAPPHKG